MRPEANQSEDSGFCLLLDEHQVRPEVAVAKIGSRSAQRVVMVTGFEGDVGGMGGYHRSQAVVEVVAMAAARLPPVVALELT